MNCPGCGRTYDGADKYCDYCLAFRPVRPGPRLQNIAKLNMTVAEVAEQLGVSGQRVRQFIKEGRLKSTKVNRMHIIDPEAVEEFRQNRSGTPNLDRLAALEERADDIERRLRLLETA